MIMNGAGGPDLKSGALASLPYHQEPLQEGIYKHFLPILYCPGFPVELR